MNWLLWGIAGLTLSFLLAVFVGKFLGHQFRDEEDQ